MKTFQIFLFAFSFLLITTTCFAQTKTASFKVSGECGMCKKKIEKAAKTAGASYAMWNTESKMLTVKYKSAGSSTTKIQKAIAGVGYDTPAYKSTEDAYNGLDDCCKYDRAGKGTATACCDAAACTKADCMKDGKCTPDMSCCKESGCSTKGCCKKANP